MILRLRIPKQEIFDAGSDEQARELVRTRLREAGFDLSRHIRYRMDRANGVHVYEQIQFGPVEYHGHVWIKSDVLGKYVRIGRLPKVRGR